MKLKSWPPKIPKEWRNKTWRSCPAVSRLNQVKHWVPKVLRTRFRWRPESCSSDSDPMPGPSGLSHMAQRPLDTNGHSSKRRREDEEETEETEEATASKRSRSKSPRRGKSKNKKCSRKSSRKTPDSSNADEDAERSSEEKLLGSWDLDWYWDTDSSVPTPVTLCPDPLSDEEATSNLHDFCSKYQVVKKHWTGGYGIVFYGVQIEDDVPVAIKSIPKDRVPYTSVEVDGTMRTIPLEVSLLMQVGAGPDSSSSSVAPRLLDWYDLGNEVVLVMERPEPCMDLQDYINAQASRCLDATEAQAILRQLVEAAIEMEARGVFHRDIKPENILIETGADVPRARFIDFGCGTTCTPGQMFHEPQGTPCYAAPEWFRQSPYSSGPTTVWQLGMCLYVMLFNKRPLINERTIASMRRVPIPSTVSDECRDLLKGCLNKHPHHRLSLEDLRNHPWVNPV